jgi:hypothetical protein
VSTARICRLALVAVIVGVLGTWRTAGPVSLNGLEGPHDGWLVIFFAAIAFAGIASLARGGRLGFALVFGCAAGILYFAVRNLVDDRDALGGSAGWGIWLTTASGLLIVGLSLAAVLRRR